jgi:excisionase family DNA binding protein
MANVPELLTVKTVARDVFNGALSTQRVYELIRKRMLPSVRLGRQVFVPADALAGFVAAGGKGLEPAPAAETPTPKRRATA